MDGNEVKVTSTSNTNKYAVKLKLVEIPFIWQLSTEIFIKKSKDKYGDRYLYHKTIYKGCNALLIVTCKTHGDISVTPVNHFKCKSSGCIGCEQLRYREVFIGKANECHSYKYDYSHVIFISYSEKVTIICPMEGHGAFNQVPSSHIYASASGCPLCGLESRSAMLRSTTEDFIRKAILAHGNTYDYSKVNYFNNYTYVTIMCKLHDEFEQTPCDHLTGNGCSDCCFKSELVCRQICEELTGLKFPKVRPDFLKNPETQSNLELDCYCEAIKLAVEYNDHSIQPHYQTDDIYIQQKQRDLFKQQGCKNNQIELFYVPLMYNFRDRVAMKEFIRKKFIEIGYKNYLLPFYQEKRRLQLKINLKTAN